MTDKDMNPAGEYLNLSMRELLSISELCSNPSFFLRQITETGQRKVITRNGRPVAGLVPLWMLDVVGKYGESFIQEFTKTLTQDELRDEVWNG